MLIELLKYFRFVFEIEYSFFLLNGVPFDSIVQMSYADSIMLSVGSQVLIIDAKYYEHTIKSQFCVNTLHSANLYQIFTYVKNKSTELSRSQYTFSGMLLYERTDEEMLPEQNDMMSGNRISVKTLDLNCEFSKIREQLDNIARMHFPQV